MSSSGIFGSQVADVDYSAGYSMPEQYAVTSSAVLYRVRKAGKYFIIKTPKDASGRSLAMLQREYELSLGKSHPNIVGIFTFEQSSVVGPGIVMEYVDGRTLCDFLAENPSLAQRRRVFMQLLDAVSYLHRCGVVHNDIKPGNIMVTRSDNSVKLLDFGLADDDAHYLARTLGCTPEYASPELLARENGIDVRSDIYSLGVVMKEMFGKRYQTIASRCRQWNKEKRYTNANELQKAMDRRAAVPLIVILSFVVLLVVMAISRHVYSLAAEQEKQTAEQARQTAEQERLTADLERLTTELEKQTAEQERLTSELQMVEMERLTKAEKTRILLSTIETGIDSVYNIFNSRIKREKYMEFGSVCLGQYYKSMREYQMQHLSSIEDPELSSIAVAVYTQAYERCIMDLELLINSLPSVYTSGLSKEEVEHYRALIFSQKPYAPYSPADDGAE